MKVVMLLAMAVLASQPRAKPSIAPVFSDSRAASFIVECRNTSARGMPQDVLAWIGAYRIDGVVPPRGVVSELRAAPPLPNQMNSQPVVPPGDAWQGLLIFVQPGGDTAHNPMAQMNEARAIEIVTHVLTAGRHTIAVRCFDAWSEDLVFYQSRPSS